jgi:hypothetical protein
MSGEIGEAVLDDGTYLYVGVSIVFLWDEHATD